MRVIPSSPSTGSTQVMQTPTPQAMASSTAHWLCAPCCAATAATARSMPIGPHAYTTSERVRVSSAGSASVTRPRWPTDPSSVRTVTDCAERRASSTPNRRASVAAPRTMCTPQPRSLSRSASANMGALP
jgi:hypothetical protein